MFTNFAQFAAVAAPTLAQIEAAHMAFGQQAADHALPILRKRLETAEAKGQTGKAKRTRNAIAQLEAGGLNASAAYDAQKTRKAKPKASKPAKPAAQPQPQAAAAYTGPGADQFAQATLALKAELANKKRLSAAEKRVLALLDLAGIA